MTSIERTVSFKDPRATTWDGPHPSDVSSDDALSELIYLISADAEITAEYNEIDGHTASYSVRALATDEVRDIDFDITLRFTPSQS